MIACALCSFFSGTEGGGRGCQHIHKNLNRDSYTKERNKPQQIIIFNTLALLCLTENNSSWEPLTFADSPPQRENPVQKFISIPPPLLSSHSHRRHNELCRNIWADSGGGGGAPFEGGEIMRLSLPHHSSCHHACMPRSRVVAVVGEGGRDTFYWRKLRGMTPPPSPAQKNHIPPRLQLVTRKKRKSNFARDLTMSMRLFPSRFRYPPPGGEKAPEIYVRGRRVVGGGTLMHIQLPCADGGAQNAVNRSFVTGGRGRGAARWIESDPTHSRPSDNLPGHFARHFWPSNYSAQLWLLAVAILTPLADYDYHRGWRRDQIRTAAAASGGYLAGDFSSPACVGGDAEKVAAKGASFPLMVFPSPRILWGKMQRVFCFLWMLASGFGF